MNRVWRRVRTVAALCAGLLAVVMGATGCSVAPNSPTIGTISVAGLSGVWRLEWLQASGQGAILTPSGSAYTLTLSSNGSASARADCNTCSGTFTLVGDSLTVLPFLACTQAACPTQYFEALYEKILAGESTVGISGSTMALISARGTLRFTR